MYLVVASEPKTIFFFWSQSFCPIVHRYVVDKHKEKGSVYLHKEWANFPELFAYQTTVRDITAFAPRVQGEGDLAIWALSTKDTLLCTLQSTLWKLSRGTAVYIYLYTYRSIWRELRVHSGAWMVWPIPKLGGSHPMPCSGFFQPTKCAANLEYLVAESVWAVWSSC